MNAPALGPLSRMAQNRAAPAANVVALGTAPPPPRRSLRHWLRSLGGPGVVGIGLLVMAAAFYLSALLPAQTRLQEERQSVASLRERIDQAGRGLKNAERPAAEQLADFYRLFPSEKELPDRLAKIFAAAQAQGLVLEQGEYKTGQDKVGRLMHYEITLPVKGEYPQIRKFLAGLAKDVPNVALEQIEFERQKVGVSMLDAKIKLLMYLEQQG